MNTPSKHIFFLLDVQMDITIHNFEPEIATGALSFHLDPPLSTLLPSHPAIK